MRQILVYCLIGESSWNITHFERGDVAVLILRLLISPAHSHSRDQL
jgi:hypothetical protein